MLCLAMENESEKYEGSEFILRWAINPLFGLYDRCLILVPSLLLYDRYLILVPSLKGNRKESKKSPRIKEEFPQSRGGKNST